MADKSVMAHDPGRADGERNGTAGDSPGANGPAGGKIRWLTVKEAAAAAGVAVKTWALWAKAGRVPQGVWGRRPTGQKCRLWHPDAVAAARCPAVGDGTWVATEEAMAVLGVAKQTWHKRLRDGTLPAGVEGHANGSRALLWRADDLRRRRAERDARRAAPFPPAGHVDRFGAAEVLGVSIAIPDLWRRQGKLAYDGELVEGPNGVACRIYAVAELERAKVEMAAADAERDRVPAGFVDFDGAAAFFGVAPGTINGWQQAGKLGRGESRNRSDGTRFHVFAVADLEAARAAMEAEANRPTAPEGFVELHEAARQLGVSAATLTDWERDGRLPEGITVPIPGTSARTKVYLTEDVERLVESLAAEAADFPPAGWVEIGEAARRAGVSVGVWKKWTQGGRADGGKWVNKPLRLGGGRCKLYRADDVDRVVAEAGRDHDFFAVPDGAGGWDVPPGYVGRVEAAAMLGMVGRTFVRWQTEGWITCGRWARPPVGERGAGRRAYPIGALRARVEAFDATGRPHVDPADPTVARVPVMTGDGSAMAATIDAADLPRVEGVRWHWAPPHSQGWGAVAGVTEAGEAVLLRGAITGEARLHKHRWCRTHLNGDRLDYRRSNLVVRAWDEQVHGQRKRKLTHFGRPPTSRYKGVCWDASAGKWRAHIQKDRIGHRLGAFDDEAAAAMAYDAAARELYGELARPNFPDGADAGEGRRAA